MVAAKDADPLPWWVDYVAIAIELHKGPWELFDCWTPRAFWMECISIWMSAHHAARGARNELSAAGAVGVPQ